MDWGTIHCKPVLPLIVKKHGKKCCPLLEFYSQMFRVIMCRNWATLKGAIDVAKWKCSLLSHVWLSATPWPVAHQAPLSMGFSRREAWSGLPFPPPDDFPTQGMNLCLLKFLHCRRILYCWAPGEPHAVYILLNKVVNKLALTTLMCSGQYMLTVCSDSFITLFCTAEIFSH